MVVYVAFYALEKLFILKMVTKNSYRIAAYANVPRRMLGFIKNELVWESPRLVVSEIESTHKQLALVVMDAAHGSRLVTVNS